MGYYDDIIVDTASVSIVCEALHADGSELCEAEVADLRAYVTAKLDSSKTAWDVNARAWGFDEGGFILDFSVESTVYVQEQTYDYPASSYSPDGDVEDVARETARELVDLLNGKYRIDYDLSPSDIKVESSEYEPDCD